MLPELGVGILICACVPGGGLGHLIVVVTGNANTELSVAINFLQIFVPLGKCMYSLHLNGANMKNVMVYSVKLTQVNSVEIYLYRGLLKLYLTVLLLPLAIL